MDKSDILQMIDEKEHLAHYGIKGQKHGIRRWQNEDGSLTPEGYRHYGVDPNRQKANISNPSWYDKRGILTKAISKAKFVSNLFVAPSKTIGKTQVQNKEDHSTIKVANKFQTDNHPKKIPLTKDEVKDFETRVTNTIGDLKNDKTYDKYVTIAGIMDSDNDATPRNILGTVAWHRHDDGEQNDHSAAAVYAREKGLSEKFEKLSDESWDLSDRDGILYYGGYGEDDNFNRDKLLLFQKNTDPDFDKKINFAKDVMAKLPNLEDAYIRKFNPGSEEYWDIPWSKLEPWQIAEINKQLGTLKHSDISSDFLAHYGIKGQKWGDRRFQNEDGSLTPEGRRRYGLKSDYSNMTDKELQEAISTKRTQNQYVDLMTEGPRKKKQEISNFIKTASSTAKSANDLADKTVYEKARSNFKEEQDYLKSRNDEINDELKNARKANDIAKIESLEAEQSLNKEKIDYYKDAQKNTDAFKGAVDTVSGLPAQYSEGIGKMATKDELEERTAIAYRNINEMDKDQLKKTVDRMMLEKQYDELVNPPQPSRWERGREVLQTVGSILSIAATAAGLVLTIKKFK